MKKFDEGLYSRRIDKLTKESGSVTKKRIVLDAAKEIAVVCLLVVTGSFFMVLAVKLGY